MTLEERGGTIIEYIENIQKSKINNAKSQPKYIWNDCYYFMWGALAGIFSCIIAEYFIKWWFG